MTTTACDALYKWNKAGESEVWRGGFELIMNKISAKIMDRDDCRIDDD
jgi:hypothetical protein